MFLPTYAVQDYVSERRHLLVNSIKGVACIAVLELADWKLTLTMPETVLLVPGYGGSGPNHWQTWIQTAEPGAHCVMGIDWKSSLLACWAVAVRKEIDNSPGTVWLVAHGFGCLATVFAAADRKDRVTGVLLVAPANPDHIDPSGFRQECTRRELANVGTVLPDSPLGLPGIVVASANDPSLPLEKAADWAERWGSHFISIGNAGKIDADSGFGPWPAGLSLLRRLRSSQSGTPLGPMELFGPLPQRRQGVLARLQHATRLALQLT